MKKYFLSVIFFPLVINAQNYKAKVDIAANNIEAKVIEWRRDFHKNPELSNREFKTSEKVANHLKNLGLEVKTGVGKTGVVGILKGNKPGLCVALRADMDALPVVERTDVAFASTVKTTYSGKDVGVMHACGHDSHMAMLMAAAEILSTMKKDINGTIKFIFQPAEEGPPLGEEGGAALMIKEGVLENPKVDAIFGIHINAQTEVGKIRYKPEGFYASADWLRIKIKGKQSHGAAPWNGIDPIVISAQIINGLQTIISRQTELTVAPAVITIGVINAGTRNNIIPEELKMEGTVRALNLPMRKILHEKINNTVTKIAESGGATAEIEIQSMCPVTFNDAKLTAKMLPTLEEVAGKENTLLSHATTGGEDFAYYQEKIPGLFVQVGAMPKGKDPHEAAPHHTPDFFIDESGFKLGVKTYCMLALDYLSFK